MMDANSKYFALWGIAAVAVALGTATYRGLHRDGRKQDSSPVVTAVAGPSWLKHLGISDVTSTAMGRMGGTQPPVASPRREPQVSTTPERSRHGMGNILNRIWRLFRSKNAEVTGMMNETFMLSGSDLYRLNCQSCHGPNGVGSPPEIKSLIGPVQGASPDFIKERMEKLGRSISDEQARELAAGAESALRERLKNGGEKMPPFRHLRGDEVEALLQYLRELAGVSGKGEKEMLVPQSLARVGEHVVKGTCRICHDATGPGGGHMAMMRGIIPSLASMPEEKSLQDVVRQVESGSSGMMMMMGGSEMPPLPFLTQEEAAAAYLYLLKYPPKP